MVTMVIKKKNEWHKPKPYDQEYYTSRLLPFPRDEQKCDQKIRWYKVQDKMSDLFPYR